MKKAGEYYSGRAKNDEREAVKILDLFTKAFCIDAEADDLEFRCDECPFEYNTEKEKGLCMVKQFKCKYVPDYKDFGSMGDH